MYVSFSSPWCGRNALRRKGKIEDTDEADIDMVVAIHNNMNENTWKEILKWEDIRRCGSNSKVGGLQKDVILTNFPPCSAVTDGLVNIAPSFREKSKSYITQYRVFPQCCCSTMVEHGGLPARPGRHQASQITRQRQRTRTARCAVHGVRYIQRAHTARCTILATSCIPQPVFELRC